MFVSKDVIAKLIADHFQCNVDCLEPQYELDHYVVNDGIHPEIKVKNIDDFDGPFSDVTEVRSFSGIEVPDKPMETISTEFVAWLKLEHHSLWDSEYSFKDIFWGDAVWTLVTPDAILSEIESKDESTVEKLRPLITEINQVKSKGLLIALHG